MTSALWLFASVGLGLATGRSSAWYAGLACGLLVYGASIVLRTQVERLGMRFAPRRS